MNANTPHDATAVALDVDHTIDRALSVLRDAQPRSGLEGRILASLEYRTDTLGGPSFRVAKGWGIARSSARGKLGGAAQLALWAASSAAILAVASMMILHHRSLERSTQAVILSGARSAQSKAGSPASVFCSMGCKDPDTARGTSNPEPFSTTNLTQPTRTVSSRPERVARSGETPVFRGCSNHHDTGCPIHDEGAAVVMGGGAATPTDAQLLADLHAPSHPAPPLPLTPEEKLFLRMLRYGNATQIAELNPEVRAKQAADETAAFKAFFPDPPPLQQPNGDTE